MKQNLLDNLKNQYNENKLSHLFLIETNDISQLENLLVNFIKEIEGSNFNINNNPDLILLNPDGKIIKKENVNIIRKSFSNFPQFSMYNYYIICEAERMNSYAFNSLLKFMEEPNDYTIGFLLCKNKSLLPETIISRCDIYKNYYDVVENKKNYEGYVNMYLNYIKSHDIGILWYNIDVLENECIEKIDIINFLNDLLKLFLEKKMFNYANITREYLNKLNYNVNLSLLLDSYALEMVDYEN